jgi:hypothetical protein
MYCSACRSHTATEQGDELAAARHSITSSASASSFGDSSIPSNFAVLEVEELLDLAGLL